MSTAAATATVTTPSVESHSGAKSETATPTTGMISATTPNGIYASSDARLLEATNLLKAVQQGITLSVGRTDENKARAQKPSVSALGTPAVASKHVRFGGNNSDTAALSAPQKQGEPGTDATAADGTRGLPPVSLRGRGRYVSPGRRASPQELEPSTSSYSKASFQSPARPTKLDGLAALSDEIPSLVATNSGNLTTVTASSTEAPALSPRKTPTSTQTVVSAASSLAHCNKTRNVPASSISCDPSTADNASPLQSHHETSTISSCTSSDQQAATSNVRFSPTPPSKTNRNPTLTPTRMTPSFVRTPTRSPANFSSLPSLDDKFTSPGLFLSPTGTDFEEKKFLGARNNDSKPPATTSSGYASYLTTPTDFALDYGKATSNFDASNVLAWLQSPTANGLFSPGGGLSSVLNTPGAGATAGNAKAPAIPPRTPRTPTVSTSFFFSDVASLPRGETTPLKQDENKKGGPGSSQKGSGSNIICISPLASNKQRGNPGTPMNFKDIFASPKETSSSAIGLAKAGKSNVRGIPMLNDTPKSKGSGSVKNTAKDPPSLDAVHLAERDLYEDEDLSVLLQLASNTPRSNVAVFRSPAVASAAAARANSTGSATASGGDLPALQLPMIGAGAGAAGARLQKKCSSQGSEDYAPPLQLGIRPTSGQQTGGLARKTTATVNVKNCRVDGLATKKKASKTPAAKTGASMPPPTLNPPYQPPETSYYLNRNSTSPPLPPNTSGPTGSMRVVVGAPPPPAVSSSDVMGASKPPDGKAKVDNKQAPSYRDFPGTMPYGGGGMYQQYPPPPNNMGAPAQGYLPYPGAPYAPTQHHPHLHHHMQQQQQPMQPQPSIYGAATNHARPKSAAKKPRSTKAKAPAGAKKRPATDTALPLPAPLQSDPTVAAAPADPAQGTPLPGVGVGPAPKKQKRSPKKKRSPVITSTVERQKCADNIRAVNAASGGKNDRAATLAAAILRGVTMRPSGKWQAQLYFAGKSRYIGVFDTREKAALAYEIAREKLKTGPAEMGGGPLSAKNTENLVNAARKAAFEGVNEQLSGPSSHDLPASLPPLP